MGSGIILSRDVLTSTTPRFNHIITCQKRTNHQQHAQSRRLGAEDGSGEDERDERSAMCQEYWVIIVSHGQSEFICYRYCYLGTMHEVHKSETGISCVTTDNATYFLGQQRQGDFTFQTPNAPGYVIDATLQSQLLVTTSTRVHTTPPLTPFSNFLSVCHEKGLKLDHPTVSASKKLSKFHT